MEVYCENSIINENIDKHIKRTKTLKVVRVVLLVVAAIILSTILYIDITIGAVGIIINIVITILLAAPFVVAFFVLKGVINKTNVEYDYLINGTIFRVVKVIMRTKRKKLTELPLSAFENIGRVTSDSYDRYAADKEVKKIFAVCHYEDEDKIIYMYYILDGVKYLLHIEPDDEMITALRQGIGRITVLDKSLKTPIFKKTEAAVSPENENKGVK